MNIYVAGLNFKLNDADLRQLFEEYGEVSSAKVIMDKFTGKSRGFGFVEMNNDGDGQKAIDALDQAEVEGKVISVSVAKPRTDSGGGGRKPFNKSKNFNRDSRGGNGGNSGGGGYGKKNYGDNW